jgi:hypothetical protein
MGPFAWAGLTVVVIEDLVLKRIWNPIDFQGHMSKVKVTGSNFYPVTSL